MSRSSYIAYFDESGDHGLETIDLTFPMFVLCGCVFKIEDYLQKTLPDFSRIKFDHFGHDAVIFHSRTIRKRLGPFQVLSDKSKREAFMERISDLFLAKPCTIIGAGIDKVRFKRQYTHPIDPYSISLLFCLERLYAYLRDNGEAGRTLTCVFEQRGKAEDEQLAAAFQRICAGDNSWGALPFHMVFASKLTNMPGLQMADLAAYPIARKIMDMRAANQAFDSLRPCFRRSPYGKVRGWGLKAFP
jgi:hypothetical protein